MKFEGRKHNTTWRLKSILEVLNLYRKSKFYKTLLFCMTIYPAVLLLSSKTMRTKIMREKDIILGNQLKEFIEIKYGLRFQYLSGGYAIESLLNTFVKNRYDFFEINKKMNKNDIVYDIGATIGEYGLKCAKKGARVFSFELIKGPYEAMRKHIYLNGFENQMTALNCRVDDKKNSIDSFVKKTKKAPTLIKMNLEGDEERVLNGAKKTLSKYKPHIILETHTIEQEKNNINFLKSKGYKIVYCKERNYGVKDFLLACQ